MAVTLLLRDALTSLLLTLVEGAVDALVRHGVSEDNITVVHVPCAYEIPLAAPSCSGKR